MSHGETAFTLPPGGKGSPPAADAGGLAGFRAFCDFLENVCGINLGDDKGYLVASRLNAIQREHGCSSVTELLKLLEGSDHRSRGLRARVVDAMTTNETLWFRDEHPFNALKETVLPACAASGARVRIWSAACSTGQEPYSISMCVEELRRERPGVLRGEVEIIGTDISGSALQVAREAVYAEHTLRRGLSPERRRAHFVDVSGGCRPRPEVSRRVQLRELNLLDSYALLGRFDVIFCRNVLIYFSAARRADILTRMVATLNPGGWLFLGGTESLPGEVRGVELQRLNRTMVYRRV